MYDNAQCCFDHDTKYDNDFISGFVPNLLRCFLFLLPNYTNIWVWFLLFALVTDEPEIFLPKYSQRAILHAAHFRRVVKIKQAQAIQ